VKHEGKKLAELCSEIGLNIVKTSVLSSRVCQSCGRKTFNAVELVQFISSGLEINVEVPLCSQNRNTQVRINRRLPSSVSSWNRSPQVKDRSSLKKPLNFSELTS